MDQSGKESQWLRWLEEHASQFLLFARQQTRSEADAQDLVQEAVLESLERHGRHEPPPLPLVYATMRRRAVDLARSEQRRAGREQTAAPQSEQWFDTSVEDRELQQLVEDAMKRLPDTYRQVITLKLWGGLTFAEIAGALAIPAATAASRYRYGLLELKKLTRGVLT